MILGQLRIGARSTTYAALLIMFNGQLHHHHRNDHYHQHVQTESSEEGENEYKGMVDGATRSPNEGPQATA